MIFVYIVRCNNGSYYTGITYDIQKRILEHNSGLTTSITKSRRPVELVYKEEFDDRIKAAQREREIKGWSRVKKENLINGLG